MTWEIKLALCFFGLVLLAVAWQCFGATTNEEAFRAVMCPADWRYTIAQRHDKRDRFDWIISRRWVAHCI